MASFGLEDLFVFDVLFFFKLHIFLANTTISVFPVDFLFLFTLSVLNASFEGSHTLAELGVHLVNVGLNMVGTEGAESDKHI